MLIFMCQPKNAVLASKLALEDRLTDILIVGYFENSKHF